MTCHKKDVFIWKKFKFIGSIKVFFLSSRSSASHARFSFVHGRIVIYGGEYEFIGVNRRLGEEIGLKLNQDPVTIPLGLIVPWIHQDCHR